MSFLALLHERYAVTADPLRTERRIELAVSILALLFLLLVAWRVVLLLAQTAPDTVEPAADSLQVTAVATAAGATPQQSIAIRERPVFWAGRRPDSGALAAGNTKKREKPAQDSGEIELLGIFDGGGSTGIIARVKGEQRRMMLGEELAGWKLVSVGPRSAVVRSGKRREELFLEQGAGGAGGKPPRAASQWPAKAKKKGSR